MKKFTAIAITLLTSQLCFADDLPNFPFVYASEEASTNIPPDSVVINFTVMSHNESSSNACAAVQGKCAEIFKTILSEYEITKQISPLKI